MLAFGICRRRPLSTCWRTASFQWLCGNAVQHHRRWQASLMQMRITRSTSSPNILPVRRGEHLKSDWRRANCLFCLQGTTTLLPRALSKAAVRRSGPLLSPVGSGPARACACLRCHWRAALQTSRPHCPRHHHQAAPRKAHAQFSLQDLTHQRKAA